MGAKQVSDTVFTLEDTITFKTAIISGILLSFLAVGVFVSFPTFYGGPFSIYLSGLFLAGDVFFVLSARKIKITFDKNTRMMTIEKFSIVGQKRFQIPLVKISKIALRQEGPMRRFNIPILRIFLDDGRVLSYDYVVDEAYDASVLCSFLGVQLVPDMGDG